MLNLAEEQGKPLKRIVTVSFAEGVEQGDGVGGGREHGDRVVHP